VERAIDEARNVIQDLREPGRAPLNLERALSLVHEEFNIGSGACFRMSVKGQRCVLDPAIQEQVLLISREALVNALRLSQAVNIECEVEYLPDALRVAIRDDGCGIDPEVLRSGRAAHWGITGMRERAASIGAHLRIQPKQGPVLRWRSAHPESYWGNVMMSITN
jgi:signal transduction histidine kinase